LTSKKKELEQLQELKPQPLPKLAPRGIRSFTVFRQTDETGVSGEGVVIEGVKLATGQAVDSMDDFIKVHIQPHPANKTIITYEDGEQETF
jgi:hypothetical protein